MNIKRIVAATDFSEASMVAVETALNLAMESKAILYLLHVLELPSGVDPMVGSSACGRGQGIRRVPGGGASLSLRTVAEVRTIPMPERLCLIQAGD